MYLSRFDTRAIAYTGNIFKFISLNIFGTICNDFFFAKATFYDENNNNNNIVKMHIFLRFLHDIIYL